MLPPLNPKDWNRQAAAHLLNRAGFGGSPAEIARVHAIGFPAAVDAFLHAPDDAAKFPKPAWAEPQDMIALRQELRGLEPEARMARQREERRDQRQNLLDLVRWWMARMRDTPNPLREKLTLFWHGHFATGAEKVKDPFLMWQQNETLRRHALGHFGEMTRAISRDPAMMAYLDTDRSRKTRPNENYARELMELFTLGIGNYTEEDIKEAARAFTGYTIDRSDQSSAFRERAHDDGQKTFLGRTANYDADGIVDRILEQRACADFIARKLWTFFAYENPDARLVTALGQTFRSNGYRLEPLLSGILRSAEFYSPRAVRTQIKSPIQWFLSTSHILDAPLPPAPLLFGCLRQMGQVPFNPPSVKGWDGGKAWITTSTLLFRYNLANFALGNGPAPAGLGVRANADRKNNRAGDILRRRIQESLDLTAIAPPSVRKDPAALVDHLVLRLFQAPLPARETAAFGKFLAEKQPDTGDEVVRDLLHLMMSTPQFQLT